MTRAFALFALLASAPAFAQDPFGPPPRVTITHPWVTPPVDPVEVRVPDSRPLRSLLPTAFGLAGGGSLEATQPRASVRTVPTATSAAALAEQTYRAPADAPGEVTATLRFEASGVTTGARAPEALTPGVSAPEVSEGPTGRTLRWEMGSGRSLVLRASAEVPRADLLAFARALPTAEILAVPATESVWVHPSYGRTVYDSPGEFWEAHPAIARISQASTKALIAALPLAPEAVWRRVTVGRTEPGAFQDLEVGGDGNVRVGAPLPIVEVEACYADGRPENEAEAAAYALTSARLPAAPESALVACLTVRALPPDEDAVMAAYRRSAIVSEAQFAPRREAAGMTRDAPFDADDEAAATRTRALLNGRYDGTPGTLGGLRGLRYADDYRGETSWAIRLDSLRLLRVRHPTAREAEAAALVARVARGPAASGESVLYAVRPNDDDRYGYSGEDAAPMSFENASRYTYRPLIGAVARGAVAEVQAGTLAYSARFPEGWALRSTAVLSRDPYRCDLQIAATAGAAFEACRLDDAISEGARAVFAGPVRAPGPLGLWREAQGGGRMEAYVLGATLPLASADGARVQPLEITEAPGAVAAVAYSAVLDADGGPVAIHVLVFQHEVLGPFAVAAVAPEAERADLDALVRETARSLTVLPRSIAP